MGKQSGISPEVAQLSSNPSSPTSGYSIIFPKTDGEWYTKNADGTVKKVTSQTTGLITEDDAFLYSIMF